MCAADLTAQAPGDQAWDVTDEQVRARLNALDPNVNVSFVLDGNQTGQRLLTTPTVQSPRSPNFDADVLAFPEGTWAFLDGSLDLGTVRDSTLSATNKFQTFAEPLEAVAQLAPISYGVMISLCSDGTTQAPRTNSSGVVLYADANQPSATRATRRRPRSRRAIRQARERCAGVGSPPRGSGRAGYLGQGPAFPDDWLCLIRRRKTRSAGRFTRPRMRSSGWRSASSWYA
jgi:hypothetical protein